MKYIVGIFLVGFVLCTFDSDASKVDKVLWKDMDMEKEHAQGLKLIVDMATNGEIKFAEGKVFCDPKCEESFREAYSLSNRTTLRMVQEENRLIRESNRRENNQKAVEREGS